MALRRQFDLLPDDRQFLDEFGSPWETIVDGSQMGARPRVSDARRL